MTNKFPCFIAKKHVVKSIAEKDHDFASQLESFSGSFSWNGYYFHPAMNGYLIRVPFTFNLSVADVNSKAIKKDFEKMKFLHLQDLKKN